MKIKPGKNYYIQCTGEYVGEVALWWKPNNQGYTCDLNLAGVYPAEEAQRIVDRRPIDVAWETKTVENRTCTHVHMDQLFERRP